MNDVIEQVDRIEAKCKKISEEFYLQNKDDLDSIRSAFIEKLSKPRRAKTTKLLHGVGKVGDVSCCIRNVQLRSYSVWKSMIKRCYSPSGEYYGKVTVAEDWHYFPNFRDWFNQHYRVGLCIDKDFLGGGIEYSADNCLMIPNKLNQLCRANSKGYHLTNAKKEGSYKYRSTMDYLSDDGKWIKQKKMFHTKDEAIDWYCDRKQERFNWCVDNDELISDYTRSKLKEYSFKRDWARDKLL